MRRRLLQATAGMIILALPVAACSSSKPAEAPSSGGSGSAAANAPAATGVNAPTKANKNYNVQFIQGVQGDEFYITMQCGAEAEAKKLGVTVTTQGPQKFDPTLQKPILDSVMAAKPDAVLIAPTDVTAMQNAAAAGRPVDEGRPGRHHHRQPELRHLGDRLGQRGRRQGGVRGAQAAQPQRRQGHGHVDRPRRLDVDARIKGFEDAVKADSKFTYLNVQYSHNDPATAANLMGSALQKDPDMVGVFAANLFSAEGTATGVRQANKGDQVKVVSFDAGPNQVKALKEGTVQALVAQQPELIGQYGVDMAVAAPGRRDRHAQGPDRVHDHHQGQRRRRRRPAPSTSPAADARSSRCPADALGGAPSCATASTVQRYCQCGASRRSWRMRVTSVTGTVVGGCTTPASAAAYGATSASTRL